MPNSTHNLDNNTIQQMFDMVYSIPQEASTFNGNIYDQGDVIPGYVDTVKAQHIWYDKSRQMTDGVINVFERLSISGGYLLGETEDDVWTYSEVLEEILKYLNKNIDNLNIKDKSIVINKDYKDALLYFKNNNIKFNIILMDAPYKLEVAEEIINLVNKYDLLYNNGILVLEYSTDKLKDNYNNLTLIKSKKYNDKYVNIYHKVID